MKKITGADARKLRLSLGQNQAEFWAKVGVIQSVGSRYETGRSIPAPVQMLLRIVHFEGLELKRLKSDVHNVGMHLRQTDPNLFATLQREAKKSREPQRA
ncbi:MAG: helix-turn-helix domain-containing protein [Rhodocyclaceae bacterium]